MRNLLAAPVWVYIGSIPNTSAALIRPLSRRKFAISAAIILAAENPPQKVRLIRISRILTKKLAADKMQLKFGLAVKILFKNLFARQDTRFIHLAYISTQISVAVLFC